MAQRLALLLTLLFPLNAHALCIGATLNGESDLGMSLYVGHTPEQIQQGLMYLPSLEDDEGMLFLMGTKDRHAFWMRNTLIPLDIVHLSDTGEILQVLSGQPLDETFLYPDQNSQYILEVRHGLIQDLQATSLSLSQQEDASCEFMSRRN